MNTTPRKFYDTGCINHGGFRYFRDEDSTTRCSGCNEIISTSDIPASGQPAKKLTQLTDNIFAVEIPEDIHDLTQLPSGLDEALLYPSHYTILFLSKEATDEDWMVVVPGKITGYGYRNYDHKDYNGGSSIFDVWIPYSCKTATESGHSLLRYKGLDPSKNYAIIKKNDL